PAHGFPAARERAALRARKFDGAAADRALAGVQARLHAAVARYQRAVVERDALRRRDVGDAGEAARDVVAVADRAVARAAALEAGALRAESDRRRRIVAVGAGLDRATEPV